MNLTEITRHLNKVYNTNVSPSSSHSSLSIDSAKSSQTQGEATVIKLPFNLISDYTGRVFIQVVLRTSMYLYAHVRLLGGHLVLT